MASRFVARLLHKGSNGSSKFIFDLMETERPKRASKYVRIGQLMATRPGRFTGGLEGVVRRQSTRRLAHPVAAIHVLKHVLLRQTQLVARRRARIFGRADAGDYIRRLSPIAARARAGILLDYPR
jgi:hypothetical protein